MHTIKVTIEGESGSGKTTVSALVEKALEQAGITVELAGPLATESTKEARLVRANDPGHGFGVAAKSKVVLEERQLNHSPVRSAA